jgi:hypothetical protein
MVFEKAGSQHFGNCAVRALVPGIFRLDLCAADEAIATRIFRGNGYHSASMFFQALVLESALRLFVLASARERFLNELR